MNFECQVARVFQARDFFTQRELLEEVWTVGLWPIFTACTPGGRAPPYPVGALKVGRAFQARRRRARPSASPHPSAEVGPSVASVTVGNASIRR